jgi:hypothetical protein
MRKKARRGTGRTLVLFLLIAPVIYFLVMYSYERHSQFDDKARMCEQQCENDGYLKSDFKWAALSRSECVCSAPAEEATLEVARP